ncbi:hypothetical protein Tco_1345467 [Tanacetum coccineum]
MVKLWQNHPHITAIPDLGLLYDSNKNLFSLQIHHNGEFTSPPERKYHFGTIDWFDLVHCDMFGMYTLKEMFTDLGYIKEKHIIERMKSKGKAVLIEEIMDHDVNDAVGKDLDADSGNIGRIPLSIERFLEDRTRRLSDEFEFRKLLAEIDHVFGLDNSSQDEQDVSNDVSFDDVIFDDVSFDDVAFDDVSFDDYYATDDSASITGKSDDVPTWFNDEDVDQGIDVEWKNDPYHNVDEPEEISDMFADLDHALDKLNQVIEAQDVSNLFVVYDQPVDDEGGMVPSEVMLEDQFGNGIPVEVVAKDKVAKGTIVGSSGEDRDVVIPHEVYAAMVAAEGLLYTKDGDVVIPTEVYNAMVAQKMLEDQNRAIKMRRVMVDEEDKDNAE